MIQKQRSFRFSIDNLAVLSEYCSMFSFRRCSHPDCNAFTFDGGSFCYHHSPDRKELKARVVHSLENDDTIHDLSIVAADFRSLSIRKGALIRGMNFSFCVFDSCTFEDDIILSSFFDYCLFIRCSFLRLDARYAVFAGSRFVNSRIYDSVVIHSNFMGIEAEDSDFSGNDFYYSNFSMSRLVGLSLDDCNLKRTNFRSCTTKNVTFRYSNLEEAYMRKEE